MDDCKELKATPKFAVQIIAAALILFSEPHLPPMLQAIGLPQWMVAAGLIVWIIGIINATNMIDGLDGLCSGVAAISAFTIAMIAITTGYSSNPAVWVMLGFSGCCVGFLFHNSNPAKIFLGDSGSMLVGFVLAVASTQVDVKRSLLVSLSLPVFLMGLPLLDVVLSMVRRTRQKRSPFRGDRSHIHHRLQQLGLSHRSAVWLLWSASGYLNLIAFFLAMVPVGQSIHIYVLVVPTLVFSMLSLYFVERRLSYQSAKFSQLFLKERNSLFADRETLIAYLKVQLLTFTEEGMPFTVVVLNSKDFLSQLSHERPARMVEFFMNLYSILRNRLRGTDLIARITDHKVVAVLARAGGGSEIGVTRYLTEKIKQLQEDFGVFQSHSDRPEGLAVLSYPKDSRQILELLELEPSDVAPSITVKPAA